jgi:hypothetical protein
MKTNEDILTTYKSLVGKRQQRDVLYQELADFFQPDVANFTKVYGLGKDNRQYIFDNTGEHSLEIFAASVIGIVANRATKWARFKTDDEDLNKQQDEAAWLEEWSDYTLANINMPSSRFYDRLYSAIIELGAFGTGAMGLFAGTKNPLAFKHIPIKGLHCMENSDGDVDTTFTKREFTILQLKQLKATSNWEFPASLTGKPDADKECVIHAVFPNTDKKQVIGTEGMGYKGKFILESEPLSLFEEGYEENPIAVGRWHTNGDDVYGRGLGEKALADVKTLQTMDMQMLMRLETINWPALQVPNTGTYGAIDLSPRAINFVDMAKGDIKPIMDGGQGFPLTVEMQDRRREMIRNAFYVNIFQTQETDPNMTATEVQVRQYEKLRQSGTNVERIVNELISPKFERSGMMLLRQNHRGILQRMPKSLSGAKIKINFDSALTRALKSEEIQGIDSSMQFVANYAQVIPDILDNYDTDQLVRERHELVGAPAKGLRKKEAVDGIRQQKAKAQEAQNTLAMAESASKTAVNANKAGMM